VHFQSTGLQAVKGNFNLKPPHVEDHPPPSASSKCKIVINGLKKANEYSDVCVQRKKRKRLKQCSKCNVWLCGTNCKYHFMYGCFLNTNILFYITRITGCGLYERGEEIKLRLQKFWDRSK
jgi:hypothetical protein